MPICTCPQTPHDSRGVIEHVGIPCLCDYASARHARSLPLIPCRLPSQLSMPSISTPAETTHA